MLLLLAYLRLAWVVVVAVGWNLSTLMINGPSFQTMNTTIAVVVLAANDHNTLTTTTDHNSAAAQKDSRLAKQATWK
jgi:hypothetical protein